MGIPIIIPCFNNYIYVENTIKQLEQINPELTKSVIILNNSSTDTRTIEYFANLSGIKIINNPNNGPWISPTKNPHIYRILPEKFIITDPDLEFNKDLPKDFINILSELSDQYKITRIGFAIRIDDFDLMYQDPDYLFGLNIFQWENQNYNPDVKIHEEHRYQLYRTGIDTTFCLVNKKYIEDNSCIRVGGNFTCRHLPFYIRDDLLNTYQKYLYWSTTINNLSTIAKLYKKYIETNYEIIHADTECILINKNDKNLLFWKEYPIINKDIFPILNKYLNIKKTFIEINTGINNLSVYAGKKSSNVYTIDPLVLPDYYFANIYKDNCDNIKFISNPNNNLIGLLEQMTKSNEISIINIDIGGNEQYILEELFEFNKKYSIPIMIKFYFDLWVLTNNEKYSYIPRNQNVYLIS
jgi:hypothetical protein